MRAKLIIPLVLVFTCVTYAKDKKAPVATKEELSAISARGRALFDYERAIWIARQAFASANTAADPAMKFIARKTDLGWTICVGSPNQTTHRFDIAFEIDEPAGTEKVSIKRVSTPRDDDTFFQSAATAAETALSDFHGENRPFDTAVLGADGDRLYVYVYPAVVKKGVLPLGGDVRYLVSADGKTLLEKRPLHKSILNTTTQSPGETVAGVHSHVLSDVPEDTDVVHAMLRRMPEFVGAGGHAYKVEADGTIAPMN